MYSINEFVIANLDSPEILSKVYSKPLNVSESVEVNEEYPISPPLEIPSIGRDDTANYTILVYMVASDLESVGYYATQDIQEMMSVGSNDNLNVIVQTGGSSNATIDDTRFIDFTKVQRHLIMKDKVQTLQDLGNLNMGLSQTLEDFLRWGTEKYPANKYVVILWDHGAGLLGFGFDNIYNDTLTLDEIDDSFDLITGPDRKIEILGFDACLMASVEVANQISSFANFLVASEEVEPAWGWDYSTVLSSIRQDPTQDGKALGKVIADSYMADTQKHSAQFADFGSDQIVTMSVIDLSKIKELVARVDELGDSFISGDKHTTYSITKSVHMTERYADSGRDSSGHVDLYDLANNIEQTFPEDRGITAQIKSAVAEAVTYHVSGEGRPGSHGISMYLQIKEYEPNAPYLRYVVGAWAGVFDYGRKILANDNLPPLINLRMEQKELQSISGKIEGEDVASVSYYFTQEVPNNNLKLKIVSLVDMDASEFAEDADLSREINLTWDEKLISLCNSNHQDCQPTSIWFEKNGKINVGFIPARLEGIHFNGSLSLIYLVRPDGTFDFVGGWSGLDENGSAQRELIPLVPGDKVYTSFYEIVYQPVEDVTRIDTVESGVPIIVSDEFGPEYYRYPGEYELVISACDYSNNCSFSDGYQFGLKEEP
jgi:hypothetical protein